MLRIDSCSPRKENSTKIQKPEEYFHSGILIWNLQWTEYITFMDGMNRMKINQNWDRNEAQNHVQDWPLK